MSYSSFHRCSNIIDGPIVITVLIVTNIDDDVAFAISVMSMSAEK